jgi:hypothetical protein
VDVRSAFLRYQDASQAIYQDWSAGGGEPLPTCFDREYLPEPYLNYGFTDVEGSCVFLSTNPGEGMAHQLPSSVAELSGGTLPSEYEPLSITLARFYEDPGKFRGYARHNVRKMKKFARVCFDAGVLQVEAIPWHSHALPSKKKVMDELLRDCRIYREYHETLKEFLSVCPAVFAWSAGNPNKRGGSGMDLKADLMEFDLGSAEALTLADGSYEVSQALFWTRESGRLRGIFVNQGSATLPADKKFDAIAKVLRA